MPTFDLRIRADSAAELRAHLLNLCDTYLQGTAASVDQIERDMAEPIEAEAEPVSHETVVEPEPEPEPVEAAKPPPVIPMPAPEPEEPEEPLPEEEPVVAKPPRGKKARAPEPAPEPVEETVDRLLQPAPKPGPLTQDVLRSKLGEYQSRHPRRSKALIALLEDVGGARRLSDVDSSLWPMLYEQAEQWLQANPEVAA